MLLNLIYCIIHSYKKYLQKKRNVKQLTCFKGSNTNTRQLKNEIENKFIKPPVRRLIIRFNKINVQIELL